MSVSLCLPHPVAVSDFMICRRLCACTGVCVLYVSFGSTVRPRAFGCVAIGSAMVCIFRSRLLVYSAASGIINAWKIIEGLVPNLSDPITCSFYDSRGRACVVCHSGAGRLCTLKYNSFRWRSIRMFNRLPKSIRMLSSCSVVGFKSKLDSYLRNMVDLPCRPGFNNSLDGGDCLHGGHYL